MAIAESARAKAMERDPRQMEIARLKDRVAELERENAALAAEIASRTKGRSRK